MSIRVLIAEDHPIVRSGIQLLVQSEPDIVVSAQASNGLEAIESVMQDPPDLRRVWPHPGSTSRVASPSGL